VFKDEDVQNFWVWIRRRKRSAHGPQCQIYLSKTNTPRFDVEFSEIFKGFNTVDELATLLLGTDGLARSFKVSEDVASARPRRRWTHLLVVL
jgi:hypothetical protein